MSEDDLQERIHQDQANKIRLRKLFYRSLVLFVMVNLFILINAYMPGENHGFIWLMILWFFFIVYQGFRSFTNTGSLSEEEDFRKKPSEIQKRKRKRKRKPLQEQEPNQSSKEV